MRIVDEEEVQVQNDRNKKVKKLIVVLIILLLLMSVAISTLILYKINNPSKITTYINGQLIPNFDQIIDIQTDENGKTEIYIPIRDFASYLNLVAEKSQYTTYKGDYFPKTEDDNKCHIVRGNEEVAIYTKASNTLYKLNLQDNNSDYDEYHIDKDVFESNGKLYTTVDGIEKGYNLVFTYDETKKVITMYTINYIIQTHQASLKGKTIGTYGELSIESRSLENTKCVFDNLLIVKSKNNKYGIVKTSDYSSFVLEPQYDSINFIENSSTFLVSSNGKVGLYSEDGRRKIDLIYDEIILMGKDSDLYVVKTNNQYGIVDENGNEILYPEYDQIGIDISSFSYNGIKNGYILLDDLIPISKDKKWGFINTKGEKISEIKYKYVGCSKIKTENNVYALLEIPEYNVIVVGDEYDKYTFMNKSGKDSILPFLFDKIYIRNITGEISYWMTYNEKDYDVLKYLKQIEQK